MSATMRRAAWRGVPSSRWPWEDTSLRVRVILGYGESTSVNHAEGTAVCYPPMTVPRAPDRVFMLNNARAPGPPYQRDWFGVATAQGFVPLVDCRYGNRATGAPGDARDPIGQSLSSLAYHLDAMDAAAGRPPRRTVFAPTGTGGRKSYELVKGAPAWTSPPDGLGNTGTYVHYDRTLAELATIRDVALSQWGQAVEVAAVFILQGVNDFNALGGPTDAITFRDRWEFTIAGFDADIPAITGQSTPPLYLFDQHPATRSGEANPSILSWPAIADRNLNGRCILVGPSYALPHNASDTNEAGTAHRTARGVVVQGELFGRALDARLRGTPLPRCRIVGAPVVAENVLTFTANRPLGPDTSAFPAMDGNLGWTLANAPGVAIEGVVVSGTTITVTLNAPPPVGATLRYATVHPNAATGADRTVPWIAETDMAGLAARTPGAWGNIRATDRADASAYVPGVVLRDWLEAFEWTNATAYVPAATTTAYVARLPTAPTPPAAWHMDRLIRRLEAAGALTGLHAFYLLAGPSQAGGLLNVMGTHASGATVTGSPTFTPYQGLKGDGVAAWVNLGFAWGSVPGATASNFVLAAYGTADAINAVGEVTAVGGGTTIGLRAKAGTSAQILSNSASADNVRAATSLGFVGAFRAGDAASYVANKGGSEATIARAAGASLPTGNIVLFRNGHSGGTYGAGKVGAVLIGAGGPLATSAAVRAEAVAALDAYMIAVGAVTAEELNPAPEYIGPNHWGPDDILAVTPAGMRVFQQSPPPPDTATAATFALYPGSDYSTTQVSALIASTATEVRGGWFPWANRADDRPGNNANPLDVPIYTSAGVPCRVEYSTVERADAATLCELAFNFGAPAHGGGVGYLDFLNAAGMADADAIAHATAAAAPDATFAFDALNGKPIKVARDKVILPPVRLCDVPLANMRESVTLDYEVADARLGPAALTFLNTAGDMIRAFGAKAVLWTNPLNGNNAFYQGINADTLYQIEDHWDFVTGALAFPGNVEGDVELSIINQLELHKGPDGSQVIPYAKLMLIIGIGAHGQEMSSEDALVCRAFLTGTHPYNPGQPFGAVAFWRNFGKPGGVLSRGYNQVIARSLGLPAS